MPMDWIYGLLGGLMIGSAAALYLLVNGRIMGASGILGSVIDGSNPTVEKALFLTGLVAAPLAYALTMGAPATNLTSNPTTLVIAGLAVGIGTRMANGCTSGHGVCGISRFSVRGIVATMVYLGAGFATMFVGRHLLGAF
ncbi:MAG: YeeE/YedE thiosulfate transporter family protein [Pseudomonadota bacterium]